MDSKAEEYIPFLAAEMVFLVVTHVSMIYVLRLSERSSSFNFFSVLKAEADCIERVKIS